MSTKALRTAARGAGAARAAEALQEHRVEVAHRLAASPAEAWRRLGRFGAIAQWQSLVSTCEVVERMDGIVRTVVMRDHTVFVERLEEFSDDARRFSYSMLSGPLDVRGYRATFAIHDTSDPTASTLVLQARFMAPGASGAGVARQLRQLFDHGLRGIDSMLATAGTPADSRHQAASAPEALLSFTKGSSP